MDKEVDNAIAALEARQRALIRRAEYALEKAGRLSDGISKLRMGLLMLNAPETSH